MIEEVLSGLTPELIDDLFDLVRQFGRPFLEGGTLFVTAVIPRTLYVSIGAGLGERKMYVLSRHDQISNQLYAIPIDGGKGGIFWDEEVTIGQIKTLIECIDGKVKLLFPAGWDASGHRERIPPRVSEQLFTRSVAETFTSPSIAMPIQIPKLLTHIHAQFDQPEKLTTFVDSFNQTYLCHVDHLEVIKNRYEAMRRVCERRGYTSYEHVRALSPNELKSLRQEFDAEFAKLFNKKSN